MTLSFHRGNIYSFLLASPLIGWLTSTAVLTTGTRSDGLGGEIKSLGGNAVPLQHGTSLPGDCLALAVIEISPLAPCIWSCTSVCKFKIGAYGVVWICLKPGVHAPIYIRIYIHACACACLFVVGTPWESVFPASRCQRHLFFLGFFIFLELLTVFSRTRGRINNMF